jgi:hypothetical protein
VRLTCCQEAKKAEEMTLCQEGESEPQLETYVREESD